MKDIMKWICIFEAVNKDWLCACELLENSEGFCVV